MMGSVHPLSDHVQTGPSSSARAQQSYFFDKVKIVAVVGDDPERPVRHLLDAGMALENIAKHCMKSILRAFSGEKPASLPTSSELEVLCYRC